MLHPPKSPNTSNSNNSTLETKAKGIKKIITEKIITTTLERNKKEKKDGLPTTLERENEKNIKLAGRNRHSDVPAALNKPERNKIRHSMGTEVIIQPENGSVPVEHSEVQKKENDPKRAMKFGIRVLPPNVPDDGVLSKRSVENGSVNVEKSVDVVDKVEQPKPAPVALIKHESETEIKKPVVAKRREKMAPPIPNARVKLNESDANTSLDTSKNTTSSLDMSKNVTSSMEISKISNTSMNTTMTSTESNLSTFGRTDLNSSGIKRDQNGIPQELPAHMFEAAKAARNNRKSSTDILVEKEKDRVEHKKEEAPKPAKKSKGKAPSPPEVDKNKTDDSILEQLKNVNDFLKSEKQHSSVLHDSSSTSTSTSKSGISYTSTPKANKTKSSSRLEESINFSQDDIDDIVSKPFRRESDSLNNYFEDSKSILSSNQDVHSVVSLNQSEKSDKGSTTVELNNSDITIHSSPTDDTLNADDSSLLDENERKAASLGDLSKFELRARTTKISTGTLERAQSLDISGDDGEINETLSPTKKRKAMSVVESTFFDSSADATPDTIDSDKSASKHKEPRLSLNIAKTSAIEGLNTFQRNRLKKASEYGNLEDAIVKGSSSSIESDRHESQESLNKKSGHELDLSKIDEADGHETSDHLARRIIDENLKVHLKLVSEFAKSTSDGSNLSSLDSSQEPQPSTAKSEPPVKYEEKLTMAYDTNIPDDVKVSRNTYANSLERPKSDMMKKLLAKNPILNVHVDHSIPKSEATTSTVKETRTIISKETPTPMTDASKSALHQPDIVNFDLKTADRKVRDYDDFVSNIRIGSNNNSTKYNTKEYTTEWTEPKETHTSNIVTINTDKNQGNDQRRASYTKSIEIGEPTLRLIPDVVEGVKRRDGKERTLYMEPASMSLTMTQEPVQKTVTVNVAEDEFGNKVITQNVEKISTKYLTTKTEAPIQVEQVTFGIMKSGGQIDELALEEGNVQDIDKKVLDEIKKQNPNIHFTSDEPAFTRTETIILNTELGEEEAKALMARLQNDPSFMAEKSPEELSRMGIRIIRELDDEQKQSQDTVEVTKTRYTIDSAAMAEASKAVEDCKESEHVTEIQVVTPRTEKVMKQKSDLTKDKISSRQRVPAYMEPPLTYELDLELLNDFILNERHHTAKQQSEALKRTKSKQSDASKRHSDFDLPRNSHIKFRTATYESPKGTLVTSTDLENRRLSQMDQQLRASAELVSGQKPVISAKPSNIPVKTEKQKLVTPTFGVSSKIPVFTTQKSLSQENLADKSFSLPRSPPPTLSSSSGNISITSIKSSSKSPSGGKF